MLQNFLHDSPCSTASQNLSVKRNLQVDMIHKMLTLLTYDLGQMIDCNPYIVVKLKFVKKSAQNTAYLMFERNT